MAAGSCRAAEDARLAVSTAKLAAADAERLSRFATSDEPLYAERGAHGLGLLLNQGATCYLNSLLYTLFCAPALRLAVLRLPWDARAAESRRSVGVELQRLFARMALSRRPALNTDALTRSFGWSNREVWTQHDVQELMHVLFDVLQRNHPGTELARMLASDLSGELLNVSRCLACGTRHERAVSFLDLPVEIKFRRATLLEALRRMQREEPMTGDNALRCEHCGGKRDAAMRLALHRLPRFLCISLKRVELDFEHFQPAKLHNPFAFPDEFDAREAANNVDGDKAAAPADGRFALFSVLMHVGTVNEGHYFCYVRHPVSQRWLQLDDLVARDVTGELSPLLNAWRAPEGPEVADAKVAVPPDVRVGEFSSPLRTAYVLWYRRVEAAEDESSAAAATADAARAALPRELAAEIEADNVAFEAERADFLRERAEAHIRVWWGGVQHRVDAPGGRFGCTGAQLLEAAARATGALNDPRRPSIAQLRLRRMDVARRVPQEPLVWLDDGGVAARTLAELGLVAFEWNELWLECALDYADARFPPFDPEALALRVAMLDAAGRLEDACVVFAAPTATVAELRALVAARLRVEPTRVVLVQIGGEFAEMLSEANESAELRRDLRLLSGDQLGAEVCRDEWRAVRDEADSPLLRHLNARAATIHVRFNHPDEADARHELSIDARQPLSALRARLAEALRIDAGSFRILRAPRGRELKQEERPLTYFGIVEHARPQFGAVALEPGVPTRENEIECEVAVVDAERRGAFVPLGMLPLLIDSSLVQVREALATRFGDALPPAPFMLVAERAGARLSRLLRDDVSLRQGLSAVRDRVQLVVLRHTTPHYRVGEDDLLLSAVRLDAASGRVEAEALPLVARASAPVRDALEALAACAGASLATLHVAKVTEMRLKRPETLAAACEWVTAANEAAREPLGQGRWRARSGDLLVFCDGDPARAAAAAGAAAGRGARRGVSSRGAAVARAQGRGADRQLHIAANDADESQ